MLSPQFHAAIVPGRTRSRKSAAARARDHPGRFGAPRRTGHGRRRTVRLVMRSAAMSVAGNPGAGRRPRARSVVRAFLQPVAAFEQEPEREQQPDHDHRPEDGVDGEDEAQRGLEREQHENESLRSGAGFGFGRASAATSDILWGFARIGNESVPLAGPGAGARGYFRHGGGDPDP